MTWLDHASLALLYALLASHYADPLPRPSKPFAWWFGGLAVLTALVTGIELIAEKAA